MILGFNAQFVSLVLDGSKRQTIRAGSRWKAGMRADLYTGAYRPGERRLLFRAIVTSVEPIEMFRDPGEWKVRLSGKILDDEEREQLFLRDGFRGQDTHPCGSLASWEACWYFGPEFTGQLILWDYDRREVPE